ncbi:MAG: Hsp20/alpha crystallin family protein [Candidatus Sulfotelmatobacter sp.]
MSAQKTNQPSTSQSISTGGQSSQGQQSGRQTSLARRNMLPSVPSLLLDPLGFFDDSPFSLLRRMQQEMNRVFAQPGVTRGAVSNPVWVPPIEVAYRDGNLVVSAELPGLDDEDITVTIRDNAIVIAGERQVEDEENEGGIQRTELRYGQFYREIPLPDGANADQARAEFNDGVLQITVPVAQEQRNERQIPIETSGSSQATGSSQSTSPKTDEQKSASAETSGAKKAA